MFDMRNREFLQLKMLNIGVDLAERQLDQFMEYYDLLIETNKVMNLTAITEFEDVVIKHFVDSVLLLKYCDLSGTKSIIDVGTGAGFPGIPLKIVFPEISITLLDSLNKRIKFLSDVVEKLQLTDVFCIHGRAEDYGQQLMYREQYDLCVSRAVANLSTLAEYCIPFVKVGGKFISYKAANADDEINGSKEAIKKLKSEIETVRNGNIPGTDIGRTFVVIEKKDVLPKRYPRKAGVPGKEPLR